MSNSYPLFALIAISIPFGIGLSTFIFFALSTIVGQNMFHLLIHTGMLFFIAIFYLQKHIRSGKYKRLAKAFQIKSLIAPSLYAFVSVYLVYRTYLNSPRSFPMNMDSLIQEDLSLQSSFLVGVNSPRLNYFYIYHPNYAGIPAVTRWLVPFHSVMLRIGKASLRISLCVPTALELLSFLISMYILAENFGLPIQIAIVAPFIGLLASGFGFFRFLIGSKRNHRLNDYVSDIADGRASRFHPLLSIVLANRSTAYSISIIAAIFLAFQLMISNHYKFERLGLLFIGFSSGLLLPIAQHQAFFAFGVYLIIFYGTQTLQVRHIKELSLFISAFLTGAAIHVPRFLNGSFIKGMMGVEAPWSRLYKRGVLFPAVDFWVDTYGVFPFILIIGFYLLKKIERQLFLPSIGSFFVFTFWKLQPNCEFNSVPIFCIFMTIAGIMYTIILFRFINMPQTEESKGAVAAICLILVAITCTSSVLGIQRQWKHQKQLWDDMDERLADWLIKKTSKTAVFHSIPIPLQPVSTLAGRQTFLECAEVTRFVGMEFDTRMELLRSFNKNGTLTGIESHVSYIIRANENKIDNNEGAIDEEKWTDVYSTRVYTVFEKTK